MNKEDSQRMLFIINPISGVKRKGIDEFRKLVDTYLDKSLFDAELILTASPGHAGRIATEGLEEGIRYFVVVGGDGSINEVGTELAGTDAVMGIIPAGSGNGLAHHLEIPVKIKEAIELINRNKVEKIDSCMVNDNFFVSIAGIGFDAKVARQYAKTAKRGFKTYARLAMKEYFSYKPHKYKLSLDGKDLKVLAFFISFANSSQFGYNTRIAPKASITDGKINVCVVKKPPVKAFPSITRLMFKRKIDHSKYVETYLAEKIIVKRKKGKTVNIDGEAVKMGRELNISIRPASLNVIVP
jgi:diacylglycerol kinase (ATP)